MNKRDITPFDTIKILMLKGEKGEQGNSGDYSSIDNKPSINGVELSGDKSSASLHLASDSDLDEIQNDILTLTEKATSAEDDIEQNSYDITKISDALTSQTETAEYNSEYFTEYREGTSPQFVKWGRVCMVTGSASPVDTITGGQTEYDMFTIPEGFRPALASLKTIQQGSSMRIWNLTLNSNGRATFSRLRNGDTAYDAETTEWLPFFVTYICEE